jgi:predicted lipoprotein with Yx(FWY)xxD motif
MADTRVWTGGTDTDWSTPANWTAPTEPITGDTAIIPATTTRDIAGSDESAVDLAAWLIEAGYLGNIGSSGSELNISASLIKFFGSGDFYFLDGAGTTDSVLINSGSMTNSIELGGDTITDCTILRGTVTLAGTIGTMANLRIGHVTNRESDVVLTIAAGATAYTAVDQAGGTVTCGSAATTWNQTAGTSTFHGAIAMTTLNLKAGSMHYTSTGTLTTAWVYGGAVLDLTGGTKTVTDLYLLPGSEAIYDSDLVTITTLHDWRGGN